MDPNSYDTSVFWSLPDEQMCEEKKQKHAADVRLHFLENVFSLY